MYMFNFIELAPQSADCRLNRYILVCHTSGRSIRNKIGAFMIRVVGMGLKGSTMLVFRVVSKVPYPLGDSLSPIPTRRFIKAHTH